MPRPACSARWGSANGTGRATPTATTTAPGTCGWPPPTWPSWAGCGWTAAAGGAGSCSTPASPPRWPPPTTAAARPRTTPTATCSGWRPTACSRPAGGRPASWSPSTCSRPCWRRDEPALEPRGDGPRPGGPAPRDHVDGRHLVAGRPGPGLPGLGGRRPRPARPRPLAATARPLGMDALVDGIAGRLGSPVDVLVGHSLGGAVAVALAGRHPRAARALVLEDPPTRSREDHAATLAAGIEADARLVRRDRRRVVRREREANPAWAEEDVEHSVDGIAAADTAALAAGLRGDLAWDLPAMVAAVRVPLLVLAARAGAGLGEAGGSALQGPGREAVRAQLPPDRFVVLDGGHCLHRDLPARWLEVVGGFADTVLGTGAGPAGQPGPSSG